MHHSSARAFLAVLALGLSLLAPATPAGATTYVMMTDEALVDRSPLIVEARVVSVSGAPVETPSTDYRVEILQRLKGGNPERRSSSGSSEASMPKAGAEDLGPHATRPRRPRPALPRAAARRHVWRQPGDPRRLPGDRSGGRACRGARSRRGHRAPHGRQGKAGERSRGRPPARRRRVLPLDRPAGAGDGRRRRITSGTGFPFPSSTSFTTPRATAATGSRSAGSPSTTAAA